MPQCFRKREVHGVLCPCGFEMKFRTELLSLLQALVLLSFRVSFLPLRASIATAEPINCTTSFLYNGERKAFENCSYLRKQSASIAWTFDVNSGTLDVAFSGSLQVTDGWVGWGINPDCPAMSGSSALVAYRGNNGSKVLPYMLRDELLDKNPRPLRWSSTDYPTSKSAVEMSGSDVIIFASLQLPTTQNQLYLIWNRGTSVVDDVPVGPCDTKSNSVASFDVYKGVSGSGRPRRTCSKQKFTATLASGVLGTTLGYIALCVLGYRMFPLPFAFLTLSVGGGCFCVGALLHGATHEEVSWDRKYHRNIGLVILCLAPIQILLSILRTICPQDTIETEPTNRHTDRELLGISTRP